MWRKHENEILAVLLGASIGLNVAVITLGRYRSKQFLRVMQDHVVVTDMALASYKALKEADPAAAQEIAYNAQFGFMINEGGLND